MSLTIGRVDALMKELIKVQEEAVADITATEMPKIVDKHDKKKSWFGLL